MFQRPVWPLPCISNFRFSYAQKKYLYDQFIEGELSGKKKSALQVHHDMRKFFKPNEYVKVQQIKSLFSRMSTAKRNGTLVEPINKGGKTSENDSIYLNSTTDNKNMDCADFRHTAISVMTEITIECEKWIMVSYDDLMYPGIVKRVHEGLITVNCMEYEESSQNLFRWPTNADENDYTYEQVISCIDAPTIVGVSTKNKRKNVYSVTDVEWRRAFDFFNWY